MNEDKELNLEELNNVYGTGNRIFDEEKALENPELHRKEQIARLREERDKLIDSDIQQDNVRSGR